MCSWSVDGRDVRPRRAAEAFWRWEQAWARRTRDMSVYCALEEDVRAEFAGAEAGGCESALPGDEDEMGSSLGGDASFSPLGAVYCQRC